jgi:hypothetical protein
VQGEAGGGRQGGQTEPEAEAAGERTAAGAQEVRAQLPEEQVARHLPAYSPQRESNPRHMRECFSNKKAPDIET